MARGHLPHPISRDSAIGGMEIDRSLRVDQGTSNVSDGSFYYRTFANSNKKTYTISVWFKKCYTVGNIGDDSYTIISCGGGGTCGASAEMASWPVASSGCPVPRLAKAFKKPKAPPDREIDLGACVAVGEGRCVTAAPPAQLLTMPPGEHYQ